MVRESQKKASEKYDKANRRNVVLRLNVKTDKDILDHLDSLDNKMGYIKELIRKDINS